jgi:hypothetical protein
VEWRRVHRPLRGTQAVATLSALAITTAIALIYAFLFGAGQPVFTLAMYLAVAAILLGVWAWNRWSYGVFVGTGGIRITCGSGTLLFARPTVAGVAVRRSTARALNSLWVLTVDGTAVETPVVRGRPRGERPAALYFAEPEFDAVVSELRAALRHPGIPPRSRQDQG